MMAQGWKMMKGRQVTMDKEGGRRERRAETRERRKEDE
jgi:hypothetical protein